MEIRKAVELLEKYKKLNNLLDIKDDNVIINEIIELVKASEKASEIHESIKKEKYDEINYKKVVETSDIESLNINEKIKSNKDNLFNFWVSLEEEEKNEFTIFELNIILFLISNYNKYIKKNKKQIINNINIAVRNRSISDSYNHIIV